VAEIFSSLHSTIKGNKIHWGSLVGAGQALAIAETAGNHNGMVLLLTNSNSEANRLEQEISFFLADTTDTPVILFPDWETLPYDSFSPHQDIISERLQALH